MKKFNQKEKKGINIDFTRIAVPMLVIACSILGIIGYTFSANLVEEKTDSYLIKIEVINGDITSYSKRILRGAFKDTFTSHNEFESLNCTQGELEYNEETGEVFSNLISQDTYCTLKYKEDNGSYLNYDGLDQAFDKKGISYYYKGDATNNYILINNLLFRIVRVNGDGSLRIILNDTDITSSYGNINYSDSNLKSMLSEWYINNISDTSLIVNEYYDIDSYNEYSVSNIIFGDIEYLDNIGTLSVKEVEIINKGVDSSYLDYGSGIFLMNSNLNGQVYALVDGQVTLVSSDTILSIRPVINIKSVKLDGDGTIDNPYKIGE